MAVIELLPSSDDEEDEKFICEKNENIQSLDITRSHPAAWVEGCGSNGSVALRHFEVFVNHPAAVRKLSCDAKKASKLKELGNEKFKAGLFPEAVELYSDALDYCPETDDYKYSAAVFLSNRAACFLSMGHYEDVIEDCNDALELDPKYVKAYTRRAHAHERLDDLDSASSDWEKVLEIDPTSYKARTEKHRLDSIIKERNEKVKDEMLGKLKDLGNSVLGKFGMSLDNFNAVQDPNTGSYSISFNQ